MAPHRQSGREYTKRVAKTARISVRMPEALLVHLQDEAEQHHRSVNAEIIHLLMDPRRRVYQEVRQHITQEMRDLAEDLYGPGGVERLDAGLPVASPMPQGDLPGRWKNGWSDDVLKDWFSDDQ